MVGGRLKKDWWKTDHLRHSCAGGNPGKTANCGDLSEDCRNFEGWIPACAGM